jgi:hypothetical protein
MLVASRTIPPGSGPGYGPGWALTVSGVTEGTHRPRVVVVGRVRSTVGAGMRGVGRSPSLPTPTMPATTAATTNAAVPATRARRRRPRRRYGWAIEVALAAGATADDVVGTLIAVAPITGLARVVAATPAVARSVGYDIDWAFEAFDSDPSD